MRIAVLYLHICMYVHHVHACLWMSAKGIRSFGIRVASGWELSHGCWELNLSFRQEQPVFVAAEMLPSFAHTDLEGGQHFRGVQDRNSNSDNHSVVTFLHRLTYNEKFLESSPCFLSHYHSLIWWNTLIMYFCITSLPYQHINKFLSGQRWKVFVAFLNAG